MVQGAGTQPPGGRITALRGPHSSSVTERRRLRERAANSCITSLFMIKRFHVFKKIKQLIFFRWVVCCTIKTKQGGGEENMLHTH